MHDVGYFMSERRELSSDMLFVMTSDEYQQAKSSRKFSRIEVERIIPYPDGRPGFYFVRLAYADNLEEILAPEREARSRPVVENVELSGQTVEVTHSPFDAGQLRNLFDNDPFTLARGLQANPLLIEFEFVEPREIRGVAATFGSMDFTLTATLMGQGGADPVVYSQTFRALPPDPRVELAFDRGPERVSGVRLEILQLNVGSETHIHVREIQFK